MKRDRCAPRAGRRLRSVGVALVFACVPVPVVAQGAVGGTRSFFSRPVFLRGDSNSDGSVDLSDVVGTLNALFLGGPRAICENAADANKDLAIDLSDAVFTLNYLFSLGSDPPPPGARFCGVDRREPQLPCASYDGCPGDGLPLVSHVLNRITFGPTEDLYTRIQSRAELREYIDEQLAAPENFDQAVVEPALHAAIDALRFGHDYDENVEAKLRKLNIMPLMDALNSEWQLLQVVTQFWNNHFHTQVDALRSNFFVTEQRGGGAVVAREELFADVDENRSGNITENEWVAFRAEHPGAFRWEEFGDLISDGVMTREELLVIQRNVAWWKYGRRYEQFGIAAELERREYETYRRLAFGSFRDLLENCAKSVAMVIYLNSFENIATEPNENFAREFFELHSFGADSVYTQHDIEELARVFTGWTAGWVRSAPFAPVDTNLIGRPDSPVLSISLTDGEPYHFPTQANWNDEIHAWAFVINPGDHDWGRKDLFLPRYGGVDSLGNPVPASSAIAIAANTADRRVSAALTEFDRVLSRVVGMRDCARFISTKLIQLFVTDDLSLLPKTGPMPTELRAYFDTVDLNRDGRIDLGEWETPIPLVLPNGRPPDVFSNLDANGDRVITRAEYREPDLLLAAMETFRQTGGDMREVIRTILHSDEFLSLDFYRAKVKTPLETITSTIRILNGTTDRGLLDRIAVDLEELGMDFFRFGDPTGESELGFDWMHTVGLLGRLAFVNRAARPVRDFERRANWNPASSVARWNLTTVDKAVDYFSLLLLSGDILPNHRALAIAQSGRNVNVPAIVAFLLSLPQFQKQ